MALMLGYLFLAIAFVMSLLLLWLICCRTPSNMKAYRPVILCGWIADFLFNAFALLGRPLYCYHGGVFYVVSSMLLSLPHNYSVNVAGTVIWVVGFFQLLIIPSFQFFCRYLMVVRKIELATRQIFSLSLLWWLSIPPMYAFLVYVADHGTFADWETARRQFGDEIVMRSDGLNGTAFRYILVLDTATPFVQFIIAVAFLILGVTYASILYFGRAIYLQFQEAKASKQHKLQIAHRNVTNILIVQPPIMGGIPCFYILIMGVLKIDSPPWMVNVFDCVLAVVPIVNPLLAVYVVRPYREAVLKAVCRHRVDGSTTSVQQISNVSTKANPNFSDVL